MTNNDTKGNGDHSLAAITGFCDEYPVDGELGVLTSVDQISTTFFEYTDCFGP